MFEHRSEPLISFPQFLIRLVKHTLHAVWMLLLWLAIGVCGYHFLNDLTLIQSFLNASMIASGMGPVDVLITPAAKLFASFYALFSSLIFIGLMGVILAPIAHRIVHKLQVDPLNKTAQDG